MVKNVQSIKKDRGMGRHQLDRIAEARKTVLMLLADGDWHQYGELREKSRLSSATLSKHLKQLKDIVEKKLDTESGKYPYPVHYRAKPEYLPVLEVVSITEHEKHEIEKIILDSNKTPLDVLDQINIKNNGSLLMALKLYKDNKDASPEFMNLMLELFVWQPYKVLTSFLIEESKKIIEKIDIENLIESNKSTMHIDKNGLKSLGWTENEIRNFMEKSGLRP